MDDSLVFVITTLVAFTIGLIIGLTCMVILIRRYISLLENQAMVIQNMIGFKHMTNAPMFQSTGVEVPNSTADLRSDEIEAAIEASEAESLGK